MPVCIICNKQFESTRDDAKACSDKCRQRAHRAGIKLRSIGKVPKEPPRSGLEDLLGGYARADYQNLLAMVDRSQSSQPITKAFIAKTGAVTLTIGPPPETPPNAPEKGFREYMELLKGVGYDPVALRKEIQDHKKLTGPQKSMLYAKFK